MDSENTASENTAVEIMTEEPVTVIPRLEMLRLAYEIEDSASQRIVHYIDVGSQVKKVDDYVEALKNKSKDANGDYWMPCVEGDRRTEIAVVPGRVTVDNVMATAEAIRKFIEG